MKILFLIQECMSKRKGGIQSKNRGSEVMVPPMNSDKGRQEYRIQTLVILEDTFEDQDYDQEVDYIQEEILESVQTDECESSMYIFEENEENNISQDNVVQTRAQANKPKTKENLEKGKEKENVDKERERVRPSGTETSKQQLVVNQSKNPPQMTYNVIDDLSKLRITFPFMEVVKIPQQRKNILKFLDEPIHRMEVVASGSRQQQSNLNRTKGKVPPFYLTIENHDVVLHNCMVDTGATNNIMPLSVMEALGMGCTKYYETGERIYAIDSRKVPAYGEIKYFYAWIIVAPHITIVFTITVVDLPPAYGVVLGRDWSAMIGGYIMNDGSCMMLPNKDGTMMRVPREPRKPFSFKKKYNELMQGYVDADIGNYAMLDQEQHDVSEIEEENYFKGFWRMSFDGACSSSGKWCWNCI
jgi:hypothetical protein